MARVRVTGGVLAMATVRSIRLGLRIGLGLRFLLGLGLWFGFGLGQGLVL